MRNKLNLFIILIIFPVRILLSKDNIYNGEVSYPQNYNLFIYTPYIQADKSKFYLSSLVNNLLKDNLLIQKSAYIPNAKPHKIIYPYPPLKENGKYIEDPNYNYLSSKKNNNLYFPIKIELINTNKSIENFFQKIDNEKIDFLKANSYHLLQKIEHKNSESFFSLTILLYWENQLIFNISQIIDEENASNGIKLISDKIREKLSGSNWGHLEVLSEPSQASVYLDDQFIGKTPLSERYLPALPYKLSIQKKGYLPTLKTINVNTGETSGYSEKLIKAKSTGSITITSVPENAFIYLDSEYKGKTPLKLNEIEEGVHQLKISKKEYQSYYKTFFISEDINEISIDISLESGSDIKLTRTDSSFSTVFNYENFFYSFLTASAFFAGGGLFYSYKMDKEEEILAKNLSSNEFESINLDEFSFNEQDLRLIESGVSKIRYYQKLSDYSFMSAGFSLLISVYFFYKSISTVENNFAFNNNFSKFSLQAFSSFNKNSGYDLRMIYHF
ncbi:MAG: PEGA domain-containing protein [Spirochaetia bacterium]|nr:PEGA domain-containing protein [Spirochaetia bacterium]